MSIGFCAEKERQLKNVFSKNVFFDDYKNNLKNDCGGGTDLNVSCVVL